MAKKDATFIFFDARVKNIIENEPGFILESEKIKTLHKKILTRTRRNRAISKGLMCQI